MNETQEDKRKPPRRIPILLFMPRFFGMFFGPLLLFFQILWRNGLIWLNQALRPGRANFSLILVLSFSVVYAEAQVEFVQLRPSKAQTEIWIQAVQTHTGTNAAEIRRRAAVSLTRCGPNVVKWLVHYPFDPQVRLIGLQSYAGNRDTNVTAEIVYALDDENEDVRWQAAAMLSEYERSELGNARIPSEVPALVKHFQDKSPKVAWLVAQTLLSSFPSATSAVLPALTNALTNADIDIRQAAAAALRGKVVGSALERYMLHLVTKRRAPDAVDWTLTIKVIDETGKPVPHLVVALDYTPPIPTDFQMSMDSTSGGLTDSNGVFVAHPFNNASEVLVRINRTWNCRTNVDFRFPQRPDSSSVQNVTVVLNHGNLYGSKEYVPSDKSPFPRWRQFPYWSATQELQAIHYGAESQ